MIPVVTSNGDTTTTTYMPMFQYYPETWKIVISAYNDESKKELKKSYYVSKNVYEEVSEGDYFRFDKQMGSTTRPVKEREATKEEKEELMK